MATVRSFRGPDLAGARPARFSTVEQAIQILETMAGQPDGVSVLETAQAIDSTKGVVSRVLSSLESQGYVRQDPISRRYHLTFKLLALAYRHADAWNFPDFCRPVLRRLSDETGETAQLALVGPEGTVLYATEDPGREVRLVSQLGRLLPLHPSAAAKVYLASLPEEQALALLAKAGLPQITEKTITSLDAFGEELRRVRAQGFGTNEGERQSEVNVVAVAVPNRKGEVVAAVMLKGLATRLTRERMESLVPLLSEAAAELSRVWPPYELRSVELDSA